jgi:hypothetical protein
MMTNNEESALELMKLGFEFPNCYRCANCVKTDHRFYISCGHPLAKAIIATEKVIREENNNPDGPLIPVLEVEIDGKEISIPGVIAKEFGVENKLFSWPVEFDPIYTLFCVFYEDSEQVENTENSPIDKAE